MTPTNANQRYMEQNAAIDRDIAAMIAPDSPQAKATPPSTTTGDKPTTEQLSEPEQRRQMEAELLADYESHSSQRSTPAARGLALDPVSNLRIHSLARATGGDPRDLLRELLHGSLTRAERKLNLAEDAGENRTRIHLFATDSKGQ